MEISNYQIDQKLKRHKDYPAILELLTQAFVAAAEPNFKDDIVLWGISLGRIDGDVFSPEDKKEIVKGLKSQHRRRQFLKEISLMEKIFKNFFLNGWVKVDVMLMQRYFSKVNKKLKLINPVLMSGSDPTGVFINYVPTATKRDRGGVLMRWMWLARIMENLDPKLVHECPYCKKIFFSKQRKMYHPECRAKYFSEKYAKDGRSKMWAKDYRKKKKRQR
jgi:hypothetical protein